MKVKLTESQYNRLLTEDTGENWGRVSKTVNAFIVRLFKKIRDKIQNGGLKMNSDIVDFIKNDVLLTQQEDLDELLGKPMEFMGVWKIPTHIPTVVELTGRGYPEGRVYVMGRTPQEALSTIAHGSEHDFEVGQMDELDVDSIMGEFDMDIVDGVFPQKGMVQNDFYDDDLSRKFEVLPYINGDTSMGVRSYQNDLSRKKLNNLLKNIG